MRRVLEMEDSDGKRGPALLVGSKGASNHFHFFTFKVSNYCPQPLNLGMLTCVKGPTHLCEGKG